MGLRVGIDIGSTFTDLALVDEDTGEQGVWKVSSTSLDYAAARRSIGSPRSWGSSTLPRLQKEALLERHGRAEYPPQFSCLYPRGKPDSCLGMAEGMSTMAMLTAAGVLQYRPDLTL